MQILPAVKKGMGSRANSTQTAGRVLKVAKTLFGLSKYSGRVLYQTQPWKIELLLRLQQNEPCVFRFISLTISKGPSCCCPFQLLRNSSSKFRSPVSAVYRRTLVFERRPGCVHGGVGIDTSTSDCLCLRAVGVCVEHTSTQKQTQRRRSSKSGNRTSRGSRCPAIYLYTECCTLRIVTEKRRLYLHTGYRA